MNKTATVLASLIAVSVTPTPASALEIRHIDLDDRHRVTESQNAGNESIVASTALAQRDNPTRHRQDHLFADTWVADIGTLLISDLDNDRYFTGFSLSVDVDTAYDSQEVYLFLQTQDSSGTISPLHRTSDFTIYGDSLTDEYQIDIDLVTSYPADSYNIIIDVHDAWDGRVLDTVAARQFSNLGQLPLESEDLDFAPDPVLPGAPANDDVNPTLGDIRVSEHAGSTSIWWLAVLAPLAFRRRKRPRQSD